jgi:phosphoribosylanthranilate isomerase
MNLFVKICGMTTPEAVTAAAAAGADAVGFVFAKSPRSVDVARACALSRALPPGILRVAVFRHPEAELARAVREGFRPDWVQSDLADRDGMPQGPGAFLPVLRAGDPWPDPLPARLLFEGPVSGSGTLADWDEAARLARRAEVLLAGGLHPGNVALAIDRVRPWGVDVSSGVEARRGIKDPDMIHAFITAARAAARNGGNAA